MSYYFRYPFAVSGDMTAMPDVVQGDGSVSLQEGYGDDYSLDLRTNPDARAIERLEYNYLMNKITGAIRFQQQNSGYPEFIPAADNGDTAYNYPAGARVIYSGTLYQAKVATNALPTDATKWDPVDVLSGVAPLTIANAQIKANAAIDATKIAAGNVSNAQFGYLSGVTSAIQTQLDGKQPTGAYITSLTGDVTGSGAGAAPTQLSATGVAAGFYPNANITVDAKGRISVAEAGPSAFDLYDSFEIWSGGLPQGWASGQAAQISESVLHVTQGTKSVNFNASGLVAMTKTVGAGVFQNFGEFVLDVFIASIGGADKVSLTCGGNTVSTPDGATGTFTLRCPIPDGATSLVIQVSGAASVYVDNLRTALKVYASNLIVNNSGFTKILGANGQTVFSEIDAILADTYTKAESDALKRIEVVNRSSNYTAVLSDANKAIIHPVADAVDRTFTIPKNADVNYPIGTTLTFVNSSPNAVTIAIDTDTMNLAGDGDDGDRTLNQYGIATAYKVTATKWLISGVGVE